MGDVVLPHLICKEEVDFVIQNTLDKLIVIRFGRKSDLVCMQHDLILAKSVELLKNLADIYIVEIGSVEIYEQYFEISIIPATVFFFNGHQIKCDYGTPDHSKWIGSFFERDDFISLVQEFVKEALHGKSIVSCPIPKGRIPQFDLLLDNF